MSTTGNTTPVSVTASPTQLTNAGNPPAGFTILNAGPGAVTVSGAPGGPGFVLQPGMATKWTDTRSSPWVQCQSGATSTVVVSDQIDIPYTPPPATPAQETGTSAQLQMALDGGPGGGYPDQTIKWGAGPFVVPMSGGPIWGSVYAYCTSTFTNNGYGGPPTSTVTITYEQPSIGKSTTLATFTGTATNGIAVTLPRTNDGYVKIVLSRPGGQLAGANVLGVFTVALTPS